MKTEKPAHKHAGKQIGTTECPGCGAEIPLKVNRNGCVYYFCAKVLTPAAAGNPAEKCMTRLSLSRTASTKLIEEFLEKEGKNHVQESENEEGQPGIGHNGGPPIGEWGDGDSGQGASGEASPGEHERPAGKGGIFGAVEHFLTGD